MTRLVDADALKKAVLNEFIKSSAFNEGLAHALMFVDNAPTVYSDCLYEAYCKLNDAEFEHTESFTVQTPKGKMVKFEKARQDGGWIPVSERLPEEADWYVVTRIHSMTGRKFVCRAFYYVNDQEFNELNVIAWQPIPKPYEGGKNDSDSSTEDIT